MSNDGTLAEGATDATNDLPTPEFGGGRRLASNTAALVGSRLVVAVLGWLGTVLIARELDQEAFGQFTLVFSILGMLSVVTDLGVGRIAVAGIMQAPADRAGDTAADATAGPDRATFAGTYLVLRSLLGVVGYALALGAVVVLGYPREVVMATAVGGVVVLLATPAAAYEVAYQVRDRLLPLAYSRVVGQLAQLALTVALVLEGGSLVWFMVPAVLRDLIVVSWVGPGAHRLMPIRYRVDPATWKRLLREAVPLTAGTAFVILYYRIDSVMLSKLDGFDAVAVYGVAYKFVDLVHFVPLALTTAILAPLTAAWPESGTAAAPARFADIVTSGGRILAFATVGPAVAFALFGAEFAGLLYGEVYEAAGSASAIVLAAEALGAQSALAITALVAAGHHRVYPFVTLAGLVFNIATNFVLIPRWSLEGAAVATLATEALVVVLLARQVRSLDVRLVDPGFALWVALAAGAALGVGAGLATVLPWFPAAVGAGVIYVAIAGLAVRRSRAGDGEAAEAAEAAS
ncbi:MAG: flippase [Acidimicrobiales bacterium]